VQQFRRHVVDDDEQAVKLIAFMIAK